MPKLQDIFFNLGSLMFGFFVVHFITYTFEKIKKFSNKKLIFLENFSKEKKNPKVFENFFSSKISKVNTRSNYNPKRNSNLIGMFKAQKGLKKLDWIKPAFLITNKALTSPVSGVSGNSLRLHRESFKSRLSIDFSQSITVRDIYFLKIGSYLYRIVSRIIV